MAQSLGSGESASNSGVGEERVVVTNKRGEKLVGLLHRGRSDELVVLCHGLRSTKEDRTMVTLTTALANQGLSTFRFDFSGNGESEGEFQFGNYKSEVDDLHAVVSYLFQEKLNVIAIVGHSKGGDVVLLYASLYNDVPIVVNISGRFAMDRGIEERLGKDYKDIIQVDAYIDVKDREGNFLFRVTEASLMERLNTDMHAASLSISKECSVLTVHGDADTTIPVEDAHEFDKIISSHTLRIIEGADHNYIAHQQELAVAVVDFITSTQEMEMVFRRGGNTLPLPRNGRSRLLRAVPSKLVAIFSAPGSAPIGLIRRIPQPFRSAPVGIFAPKCFQLPYLWL